MSETPPKPVALEAREAGEDGRRFSPSVARNREPIRDAFAEHAARQGRVLEIASGTGEHGAFLTDELTGLECRVFLHEYDHLIGVTFDQRVGNLSFKMAKDKRKKDLKKAERKS